MYFSNMFCYGAANDRVGITGIKGCMGVVYVGAQSMYAIHIPPDGEDVVTQAGQVFVSFIKNNEAQVGKGGYLVGFANGSNRTLGSKTVLTGPQELKLMKKALNSPPTQLVQIMKHLGPGSGGASADAVVIMVERTHASPFAPHGVLSYYKRNDDITWVDGGQDATGQYKPRPIYLGAQVPSDLFGLWRRMSNENCTTTTV